MRAPPRSAPRRPRAPSLGEREVPLDEREGGGDARKPGRCEAPRGGEVEFGGGGLAPIDVEARVQGLGERSGAGAPAAARAIAAAAKASRAGPTASARAGRRRGGAARRPRGGDGRPRGARQARAWWRKGRERIAGAVRRHGEERPLDALGAPRALWPRGGRSRRRWAAAPRRDAPRSGGRRRARPRRARRARDRRGVCSPRGRGRGSAAAASVSPRARDAGEHAPRVDGRRLRGRGERRGPRRRSRGRRRGGPPRATAATAT